MLLAMVLAMSSAVVLGADGQRAAAPFRAAALRYGPVSPPPSIRFVTTDDFPPFDFVDAGGRLTGFNVELARAICQRLAIA